MIKQMIIKNYRSHKETILDFHPNVNVIVGRGQAGKTNVMRAFDTLRTNRPIGFKYHSWFAGDSDTAITVTTTEGHSITFTKNKDGAGYLVDWPVTKLSNRHEEYRKIATKVPDEVTQLLNMVDLNMQWQHDSPYLITGNVGQIGKAINEVIDFEEIDKWIKTLRGERTQVQQERKIIRQNLTNAQAKLASLPDLKTAGDLIAEAELMDTRLKSDQYALDGLTRIVDNIEKYEYDMVRFAPMLRTQDIIENAEGIQIQITDDEALLAWLQTGITTKAALDKAHHHFKQAEADLWEAVLQMGKCPTCGETNLTKEHLNHIMEAL